MTETNYREEKIDKNGEGYKSQGEREKPFELTAFGKIGGRDKKGITEDIDQSDPEEFDRGEVRSWIFPLVDQPYQAHQAQKHSNAEE